MKKITLLLFVCLIQTIGLLKVAGQTQVGIPIKNVEGYVLEFKQPFTEISIDINDNNFTKDEKITVTVSGQTKFTDKKKKPIEPNLIRSGAMIEISGERIGSAVAATEIKVLIDIENREVSVKGYFEGLDGDKAWIDGRSVKLAEGASVRGTDEWKGKTFNSFNEMMLGSEVEIKKGILKTDGIIYAVAIETSPNIYTKGDKNLAVSVQRNILIPNGLAGGVGKVLGKEVEFVENLELQTYVTKVGYKVIPRYQKDLAKDDPAKITFRFMVIEDESFNAYALPDGSIFVHTGLLKQIKNEAQLAGVLGHEIAHVTHEHSRKQIEDPKNTWLPLLMQTGGAIAGGRLGLTLGQLGSQAILNKFGRDKEDQADRIGLMYMSQAGYDAREVSNVWRVIAKEIKESSVTNFLYSDHSMARQRVKNLNREMSYSFYDTDFSQTKKGEDEYTKIVGAYFGWIQKTQPKPAFQNLSETSPTQKTLVKPALPTLPPPIVDADGFETFFAKFKKAVLAGNRIALKNMMATKFEWATDGSGTTEEALQNMDSMKLWTGLKDAMLKHPVQCKQTECNNRNGYHAWSSDKYKFEIMFERNVTGEWKWTAVLGD